MKILVLLGGTSNERTISIKSGKTVAAALRTAGHKVLLADPAKNTFNLAELIGHCDAVFPILHGTGGEDGSIQGLLEELNKPFLGSKYQASKQTFNKVTYKEKLAENGFLTPNWERVNNTTFISSDLSRKSYVLKPISGGSSIDTLIVHNPQHQPVDHQQITRLFKKYKHMLIEELIEGQEITVGVLDLKALPIILIIPPSGEEFDFENKYNGKTQEIVLPKQVTRSAQTHAQKLAEEIHTVTGCRHYSRTDMIIQGDGTIYILETNTIPGLTKQSLFPKAAAAAGIDMPLLVDTFVNLVMN